MPDEHDAYLARRAIDEDRCARTASCDVAASVHRRLAKAYRMRLRALAHGEMKRSADRRREGSDAGPVDQAPAIGALIADRA